MSLFQPLCRCLYLFSSSTWLIHRQSIINCASTPASLLHLTLPVSFLPCFHYIINPLPLIPRLNTTTTTTTTTTFDASTNCISVGSRARFADFEDGTFQVPHLPLSPSLSAAVIAMAAVTRAGPAVSAETPNGIFLEPHRRPVSIPVSQASPLPTRAEISQRPQFPSTHTLSPVRPLALPLPHCISGADSPCRHAAPLPLPLLPSDQPLVLTSIWPDPAQGYALVVAMDRLTADGCS